MTSKIALTLAVFLSAPLFAQSKIQAWRLGSHPSLMLTDKHLVEETNGGLSPTAEGAFIYIEEMLIPHLHTPQTVFASFTKKNYPSHIVIRVMDAFTDEEIFQVKMEEPGALPWQALPQSDRIYFIVDLVGSDIELRAVGMISEMVPLINRDQFSLSPSIVNALKDTLSVKVSLVRDTSLTLFVYDSQGHLVTRLADAVILPAGDYEYFWDPSSQAARPSGEDFQVWMKALHPDAVPVEMTLGFRLIP